jgi:hypothetical protein
MLDDTEEMQILVQRLQKGRHLHRAPAHHVVDLYHLVELPDLFAIIEVTQDRTVREVAVEVLNWLGWPERGSDLPC